MNLDHTLIALADPTRRAILQRLSKGEARVTELAAPFDISLNSVSKHIRILERADLVRRRVSGREHCRSLSLHPPDRISYLGTSAYISIPPTRTSDHPMFSYQAIT